MTRKKPDWEHAFLLRFQGYTFEHIAAAIGVQPPTLRKHAERNRWREKIAKAKQEGEARLAEISANLDQIRREYRAKALRLANKGLAVLEQAEPTEASLTDYGKNLDRLDEITRRTLGLPNQAVTDPKKFGSAWIVAVQKGHMLKDPRDALKVSGANAPALDQPKEESLGLLSDNT